VFRLCNSRRIIAGELESRSETCEFGFNLLDTMPSENEVVIVPPATRRRAAIKIPRRTADGDFYSYEHTASSLDDSATGVSSESLRKCCAANNGGIARLQHLENHARLPEAHPLAGQSRSGAYRDMVSGYPYRVHAPPLARKPL